MGKNRGQGHHDTVRRQFSSRLDLDALMDELEQSHPAPCPDSERPVASGSRDLPPHSRHTKIERNARPIKRSNNPFIIGRLAIPGQLTDVETQLAKWHKDGNLRSRQVRRDPHIPYVPRDQTRQLPIKNSGDFYQFLDERKIEAETAYQFTTFTIHDVQKSSSNQGFQLVFRGTGESSDYYPEDDVILGERNHISGAIFERSEEKKQKMARMVIANIQFGEQPIPGGLVPEISKMVVGRELTLEPLSMIPAN